MENKMKVLVWGDLVTKTGFERVNSSIFSKLVDKMDVVGLGVNYRGDPHQGKFPVFPAGLKGDIYGMNRIKEFVSDKLDYIFMLNDVWVLDKYLVAIKEAWGDSPERPKIVAYFPVDALEHDSAWYRNFDIVDTPVTYTEFGKEVVLKAAPELKDKLRVIPHGTDIDTFFMLDRQEARKSLFGSATNDFIILNANRNQPRKKLDLTMEGFKIFSEGKKDVKLYMHCGVVDMHIDVVKLAIRLGIDNKLILTNVGRGPQQVPEHMLNLIYNVCDVGINTSLGEGWGLTAVEHACTGAPQIVPDSSACKELFSDCGILVPAEANLLLDNIMTVGKLVSAKDVASAMEILYADKELYKELSEKAYKKFTSKTYQWEEIAKTWYSLFEELNDKTTLAQ